MARRGYPDEEYDNPYAAGRFAFDRSAERARLLDSPMAEYPNEWQALADEDSPLYQSVTPPHVAPEGSGIYIADRSANETEDEKGFLDSRFDQAAAANAQVPRSMRTLTPQGQQVQQAYLNKNVGSASMRLPLQDDAQAHAMKMKEMELGQRAIAEQLSSLDKREAEYLIKPAEAKVVRDDLIRRLNGGRAQVSGLQPPPSAAPQLPPAMPKLPNGWTASEPDEQGLITVRSPTGRVARGTAQELTAKFGSR